MDTETEINKALFDINDMKVISDWEVSVNNCCGGGGTGQEFYTNLKISGNSGGNKWYAAISGECWIKAIFTKPSPVCLLRMKSANDVPDRDPYNIRVLGKGNRNDSEYFTIKEFYALPFTERYQFIDLNLDNEKAVEEIKIVITANRSFAEQRHWGSGTQLAEVEFYEFKQ